MVCTDNKKHILSRVAIGENSVTGKVTDTQKRLIAQAARAYLSKTGYVVPLQPTGSPTEPLMKIDVYDLKIKKKESKDRISKQGIMTSSVNLRIPIYFKGQLKTVECSSSEPITESVTYQYPKWESEKLPPDEKIVRNLAVETVKESLAQLIPQKVRILRPVKGGSGAIGKTANLVDQENYELAIKVGEKALAKAKKPAAELYYNVGVAYEAKAWHQDSLENQLKYLEKALSYYQKAAELKSDDPDINRTVRELTDEIKIIKDSLQNQKEFSEKVSQQEESEF
jgi:tetratricopeptide (TPR) repeat protein